MIDIQEYHRPNSVEEALELLSRSGVRTALLGGGTTLIPQSDVIQDLIDLQALDLNEIRSEGETLELGALCRIQDIVENSDVPLLLQTTAKWEGPNTLRNAGTLGGLCITADWESELFAALLVCEATVTWMSLAGINEIRLSEFNRDMLQGGLLTSITIRNSGVTAGERIARTPADKPIVSVVGRRDDDEVTRLAACGVASRPVLLDLQHLDELEPPDDFRGTSDYRQQMVALLSQRVLTHLEG
jgi:CO/xanthine dehydrogenase FAD-binding subunit